ncbi:MULTISPECIES: hypothetical protein [Haloferax]|uniref:Uncharacterized protein n=1 Tax=Haloferax marinum TaxID=2666143 RepID=A0A6A8G387_9EURY|nr:MULTISPECIES: hypothetical protein [Haloferax]KAB1196347.1 hypothetical protein Hfx1150_01970 [Haloferax sp. CBA1150]MRW95339.1 hypothetical protein [Haloferax marinum]
MKQKPVSKDGREILDVKTIDKSDNWWMGVVRDLYLETGEIRVRLEREAWDSNQGAWRNVHVWRVRPEFWNAEVDAVSRVQKGLGESPPWTPVDETIDVLEYVKVRKDEHRWVAAVEAKSHNWWNSKTRLYHWDPDDGTRKQSWTVGKNWYKAKRAASVMLSK